MDEFLLTGDISKFKDIKININIGRYLQTDHTMQSVNTILNFVRNNSLGGFGTFFHYTDIRGFDAITTGIRKSSFKGRQPRVCFTDRLLTPEEAVNVLFIGNSNYINRGSGDFVISFNLRSGVTYESYEMNNTGIFEHWMRDSIRFGKNADLIYSGPNPYLLTYPYQLKP